jgi:transposase-like protein
LSCKTNNFKRKKGVIVNSIIAFLIQFNQSLLAKIEELISFIEQLLVIIEQLTPQKKDWDHKSPEYKRFSVDKPPVVREIQKQDYRELIKREKELFGKTIKPVKSRKSLPVPESVSCPYCGAPGEYIYDNNGGRGQFRCKVCHSTFFMLQTKIRPVSFYCPYCGNLLHKLRERKGFTVHKCMSYNCSFYKHSLASLSDEDKLECHKHPSRFKLHYIYREFTTDFFAMDLKSLPDGAVNFNFRKFSPHILGLCLTYVVNCGLSTRQTRDVLRDIHGVVISHGMIARYIRTASAIVTPFVLDFDYNPSNYTAADETYVKVKGVTHYVWFIMDAIRKSILGFAVSSERTLEPCMLAMRRAFSTFKDFPGMNLKFIADGYPVYKLAQLQFAMKDMAFPLTQVIGLTNNDPVSKEYRWIKQVIERLNRTFKFSYRVTCGYNTFAGADSHVAIFVALYNFLRPHPYNYHRPLNQIPELEKCPNMPAKWQKLIELSQIHLSKLQRQAV